MCGPCKTKNSKLVSEFPRASAPLCSLRQLKKLYQILCPSSSSSSFDFFTDFSYGYRGLNPILHGGWFTEPPLVDDLSWFLGGCSKWAQISWLCFFQHFPRPIEAIFQKKFEILKNWKKIFLIVRHQRVPPLRKKFSKSIFSIY